MKNNSIIILLSIFVAIVVLIYLGNKLVINKDLPSLGEYMGSTTEQIKKELGSIASSTALTVGNKMIMVQTPKGSMNAEVAESAESLEKGLSNRESLDEDHGMIFVMPIVDIYNFWMKDMKFPLDIIWIDENKTVVDIDFNVSPDTYPNYFTPDSVVKYVFEVNAGIAEKNNIVVGTKLGF